MNESSREEQITLKLLEAVDSRSDVTQRDLASYLGVALGLTNSYLKRCVNKGLIKIQQVPTNRYLYYLTPKGFAEKGKLTARYLSRSFDFYREAGADCKRELKMCVDMGWRDVVLCGISDLAEIAYLRAQEFPVCVRAVLDVGRRVDSFVGLPVFDDFDDLPPTQAFLVTALKDVGGIYEALVARVDTERVLVPLLLRSAIAPT